jgi:hypothetical protein
MGHEETAVEFTITDSTFILERISGPVGPHAIEAAEV